MPSVFDSISQLGPAGLVVEALVATASAIGLLLAFILLRRAIRSRYFRRLNRRTLELPHNWEKIIGGVISPAKKSVLLVSADWVESSYPRRQSRSWSISPRANSMFRHQLCKAHCSVASGRNLPLCFPMYIKRTTVCDPCWRVFWRKSLHRDWTATCFC